MAKTSLIKRVRKFYKDTLDFLSFCVSVNVYLWQSCKNFVFEKTLPLTTKYLSRPPRPPVVTVKDVRCKRIRLGIQPQLSSPFNVEQYETEYSDYPKEGYEPNWSCVGKNELLHRTVARLKPGNQYIFRIRTHNRKGVSGWSNTVVATTKLEPIEGGGSALNYTWTQSFTEIGLTFKVPEGTTKRNVEFDLKPDYLKVSLTGPSKTQVLAEGTLSKKVKSFSKGSYWELVRDSGQLVLILTLEKEARSMSPKFDFWRNVFQGEAEIDTHYIAYDQDQAPSIIQPAALDPGQLSSLGY